MYKEPAPKRASLQIHNPKGVIMRYYIFNKPSGCITARKDDRHRTVFDYLTDLDIEGLFPVGRLDKDTEGLLLITDDGQWNEKLMQPDMKVPKKYFFCATNTLSDEAINRIEEGVEILKGAPKTSPSKLEIIEAGYYKELEDKKEYDLPKELLPTRYNPMVTFGYLTIKEGKKHQVKRMLRSEGCRVLFLRRVSIGKLELSKDLKKGQYRIMTEEERRLCEEKY